MTEEAGDRRGEMGGMAVLAGGRRTRIKEVGVIERYDISAHQDI
jgi:hypothetical protein